MTTIKLLSAGLIVTAMLAAPAMARETHEAGRYVAGESNTTTFPTAHHADGHFDIPAQSAQHCRRHRTAKIATSAITRLFAEKLLPLSFASSPTITKPWGDLRVSSTLNAN